MKISSNTKKRIFLTLCVDVCVDRKGIHRITLGESADFALRLSSSFFKREIEEWMEAYLAKEPIALEVPLVSPFFEPLLDIPFGETRTYGQLAAQIGKPKAARAIGKYCHMNPYPLIVPCHRVVAKNGLGGFAYGKSMKQNLLEYEAVTLHNKISSEIEDKTHEVCL